ncbi:MAG: NAD(P)/FAD-dependent oxidoreductase [Defluviitaleaceae bacterium]|nr:NAD(P)/FAD-dependent oxidoreductase [Defluviitaleaceae bacterium]
MKTIIVVGGGAAGMMAAGAAAEYGANAILIEKNATLGKKLLLTGGGRCNITNTADVADFVDKVPRNPYFLYRALHGFDYAALRDFLHSLGLATKVEEAGRVFPASDDANDVLVAFTRYLRRGGVEIMLDTTVSNIVPRGTNGFIITLGDGREIGGDGVIIATGGLAAPHTGSTGDGYRLAKNFGHDVTKLHPSLAPLVVSKPSLADAMGLSLPDVGLTAKQDGKTVYKDAGDIIFTHFGLSGPVVLRASAYLARQMHLPHDLYLDFAHSQSEKDLEDNIIAIFGQNPNKDIKNCLDGIFPGKLVGLLLEASDIRENEKARDVTREARKALCRNIKAFRLEVTGSVGFGAAAITCGGVNCNEIDPSTMQSKLMPGLYFAGEVMDVDALTGGYNLAIAFAMGRLAGTCAALGGESAG